VPLLNLKKNSMDTNIEKLIKKAYKAFNSKDLDTALSTLHPNVDWPKAFEGGYVNRPEEVKEYWIRQGAEINATVNPIKIVVRENGTYEVTIHQLVKDLEEKVLFDGIIKHVYTIQDNLLRRMDIELN
jgi:hypothetical protein